MHCTRVLVLIVLLVGLVQSFPWDMVVGEEKQLNFYYNNGTLTHTERIPLTQYVITSVTYDPARHRVLFAGHHQETMSISSFDLSSGTVERLFTKTTGYHVRAAYDPVTQALFWPEGHSIYTFSLNPTSYNKADAHPLLSFEQYCYDLAVDSCGGYLYWIRNKAIERARLDGSQRQVIIDSEVYYRLSLALDLRTQTMYWTEVTNDGDDHVSIESADFNGKNRKTIYVVRNTDSVVSLAVSNDYIYWQNHVQEEVWKLAKYSTQTVAPRLHSKSGPLWGGFNRIATNYTIEQQIQGVDSCDALQALLPQHSKRECAVSVCQNYCVQGECRVSAAGSPTCSCKAGYSGERCEVNACLEHCLHGGVCSRSEDHQPVCRCAAGYEGARCEVAICRDYCLQGNCSVGADGQPECSCMPGYSGERCEENACHKHCLNGGVCSLNEEDEPACRCAPGYGGGRCELSADKDNSCEVGSSGEGTVSACHQFCLNNGVCSLNEAREPVCRCTADYEGERCDVPAFVVKWFLYAYKNVPRVALSGAI